MNSARVDSSGTHRVKLGSARPAMSKRSNTKTRRIGNQPEPVALVAGSAMLRDGFVCGMRIIHRE